MIRGPKPKPLAERLSKWKLGGPNGDCWEWQGMINNKNGYGYMYYKGRTQQVHRLSYAYYNQGADMEGKDVRHTCDNRRCMNPSHLLLGSRKENMADAIERDRLLRGEDRWNSKLTRQQVLEIKQLLANGKLTQQEIADKYGVTRSCVSKIKRGLTWI